MRTSSEQQRESDSERDCRAAQAYKTKLTASELEKIKEDEHGHDGPGYHKASMRAMYRTCTK